MQMWPAVVCCILWHATLDADAKEAIGTPFSTAVKNRTDELPIGTPSKMIANHFSRLNVADSGDDEEDSNQRLIIKIHSS